jgi:hypothetical protein
MAASMAKMVTRREGREDYLRRDGLAIDNETMQSNSRMPAAISKPGRAGEKSLLDDGEMRYCIDCEMT